MITLAGVMAFLQESQEREVKEWERRLANYKRDTSYYIEKIEEYKEQTEKREKIVDELEEFLYFYENSKFENAIASIRTKYDFSVRELKDAKYEYNYYSVCLDTNDRNIKYAEKQLEIAKANCATNPEVNRLAQKVYGDFEIINKMKQIKDIYYDTEEGYIYIITECLAIHEPITGKRFELGEATICLRDHENLANNIKIKTNNKRIGYGRDVMYHPHVFANQEACWGTAQNDLILAANRGDYISLVLTILLFLQTCDIKDVAGRYVGAWDEIDQNNSIIHYGKDMLILGTDGNYYDDDDMSSCDICGHIEHSEDLYSCDNCDNYVCENCQTEIQVWTEDYITVCDNCYDEYYFECPDCHLYVHTDDGVQVGTDWLCPHCAEERRNEDVHPF